MACEKEMLNMVFYKSLYRSDWEGTLEETLDQFRECIDYRRMRG